MKILYANPVFSDYRIPFYKRLYELFDGNFNVMYSPYRFRMEGLSSVLAKVPKDLKDIAYPYEGEKVIKIRMYFSKNFDSYLRIPILKNYFRNVAAYRPDVLITEGFFQWTPFLIWYALRHKAQVYISYERTAHTERFVPKIKELQRKFTDRFISGYLVNGTETQQYLLSLGIKKKKIHKIGMNADGEGLIKKVFSMNEDARKKFRIDNNISSGGIVYLFSGQFIPRKGIFQLLEAWIKHVEKYHNDHLIMIGAGELLDVAKSKFSTVPSIHLQGKIPYDSVYKYYAISDVFVMPTLEDNWCLVVPEAMACGLPIACSKYNGGAIDLIKENINGIIFDPLDSNNLVTALDYFHDKDITEMGNRSKEIEELFSTNNCAQRLYNTVTKNNIE